MAYDKQNVFAKILRSEIPCKKIYEDAYVLAFEDIAPAAPVHVLVVPKGDYVSLHDFTVGATADMVQGFFIAIQRVVEKIGLEKSGYRIISNHGADAGQIVPHFHVHILGGKNLGTLVA